MTWRATSARPYEQVVLPELLELVNDEERSVRLSAYQCAVELLVGESTNQSEGGAGGAIRPGSKVGRCKLTLSNPP